MRPILTGRDRRDRDLEMADRYLAHYQETVAVFGQVIARLVESEGGSWRVVECGTCRTDGGSFARFLEIQLPDGPEILVALHDHDVISAEVERLDQPVSSTTRASDLKAWVQGITPLQE